MLHNCPLTREQAWRVGLINCGPRATLTSFTGLEALGLTGWERAEVHVITAAGVPAPRLPDLAIRLHRTGRWEAGQVFAGRACHRLASAAIIAASSFASPRPACGLLAATVQQRLTRPEQLRSALVLACRTRHRAALLAAVDDIAMGSQALSEIDFVRLCRRTGLPPPIRQAVRVEPDGRCRYLDAE